MRTRPHHERHAFAVSISIAVMAFLFVLWGFLFLRKIKAVPLPVTETPVTAEVQ
jgi:hypothetical protein